MVSSGVSGGAMAVSLIGVPAGTIVDFLDGAVYRADPNPVSSSLECKLLPVAATPATLLAPAAPSAPAPETSTASTP